MLLRPAWSRGLIEKDQSVSRTLAGHGTSPSVDPFTGVDGLEPRVCPVKCPRGLNRDVRVPETRRTGTFRVRNDISDRAQIELPASITSDTACQHARAELPLLTSWFVDQRRTHQLFAGSGIDVPISNKRVLPMRICDSK